MSLILLNLQSEQQIELNSDSPFIIGRGNVVGCCDKRVSRNHGKITCTLDGKVRLAALHCNPCFFTRNGVPPVRQLNKNEEETLNEGDHLGLLPNEFWFKIISSKKKDVKIEPSSNNSVNEDNNTSVSNYQTEERLTSKNDECKPIIKNEKDSLISSPVLPSSTKSDLVGESNKLGTPEFEKTKRLPLWMYEIDEPKQYNKSPSKRPLPRENEFEEKKQKLIPESRSKITNIELPSTSEIKTEVEDCEQLNPTVEFQNTTQSQAEAIEENTKEDYEDVVDPEKNDAVKRPLCQYEANCYRKNPQHKLDFCHPGDPDYVPYQERPFCQFGSACYRKNEQHRVDFQHPSPGSNSHDHSSPSCSRCSIGEERPPCLSGSRCSNQNFQHRKELYHPPKGYICHFSNAGTIVSDESSLDWESNSTVDCYFEDYNNWDGYWKSNYDDDDFDFDFF